MISKEWDNILAEEYKKDYYIELMSFINNEYNTDIIYPEYKDIFNCFKLTEQKDIKVVILGQDPYHGENEAHGLSFSVKEGTKIPPSLRNIYKELESDLNIDNFGKTDLTPWANEGVLLLNSILTVRKDTPASHRNKGWEIFTDEVIKTISKREEPIIFVLWGKFAESKKELIKKHHHIIISSHPSPFSARRSFFGSKPFSSINNILKKENKKEINWKL